MLKKSTGQQQTTLNFGQAPAAAPAGGAGRTDI
jgi:hypothetical protein